MLRNPPLPSAADGRCVGAATRAYLQAYSAFQSGQYSPTGAHPAFEFGYQDDVFPCRSARLSAIHTHREAQ